MLDHYKQVVYIPHEKVSLQMNKHYCTDLKTIS